MLNRSYALRLRVLIGMAVFLLLVILQALHQLQVQKNSENNYRLLGEMDQIEQAIADFPRRSNTYLSNAARDFESYRRDVIVFYKDMLGDFDRLESQLSNARDRLQTNPGDTLANLLTDGSARNTLDTAITQTLADWAGFKEGFHAKLGDDKAEPRLEWGAEFVVDNHPQLQISVDTMIGHYRAYLDAQAKANQQVLLIGIAIIAALGVLGIVWFYRRVIRRIGVTVDGCRAVSAGNFGYTLPTDGDDEITVLSRSFNTLSSRTQLVLGMMANLQRMQSVEQGLAAIVQASGSYLPVAWAGFMRVGGDGDTMLLTNAIPPKTLQGWNARGTTAGSPFGKRLADALVSGRSIIFTKLSEQALAEDADVFIRNLVRATKIEALMALPLKSHDGWEGIVLFGSRNAEYRDDQTELLDNMAPLMAASFERAMRQKD